MNRWNLAWLLGIPAVVVLGLAVSYSAPVSREQEQDYELIRLIAEVLSEVDHNYVRPLDPDARRRLVEDMIAGGLERLDPHTTFFSESDFKNFRRKNKGRFGGVGIQVVPDRGGNGLLVTSPMVGSPAYDMGVQPGDLIIKVNGVSLEHRRSNEAIDLILGEPGTDVTLTVLHEGDTKPQDITITRAVIDVPSVLGDRRRTDDPKDWDFIIDKDHQIAYVRVTEFDEPTTAELKTVLTRLQKDGVRGLVLDLRGNPGGLLPSAVETVDMFVAQGTVVSTRHRRSDADQIHVAKPGNDLFEPASDHPMVVLIDRWSASAAEIVAAALQDHGRAVVVGERSYGKGSVQTVHPLDDKKSAVKLTVASYWRPSGKNIHRFPDAKETDEWGVRPNEGFEVPLTDAERKEFLEGRRARDIVPGKTGHLPDKLRARIDAPFTDKVLEKGLDHIRKQLGPAKTAA
jgi:carboxyl-terminal processing protease